MLARHVRAAQRISRQFEDRTVAKLYWAVVEGRVEPDEGTWTDYLHKRHGMPQSIVVPPDDERGKRAVLQYRVLVRQDGRTWLEIELETGRTHQIRIQSASRGHPVVGDVQYGADADVRRAVRGRAAAGDRAARAAAGIQRPDDPRAGGHHGPDAAGVGVAGAAGGMVVAAGRSLCYNVLHEHFLGAYSRSAAP